MGQICMIVSDQMKKKSLLGTCKKSSAKKRLHELEGTVWKHCLLECVNSSTA